jgi:ABC-type sugar transport system ATPase subunit
MNVVAASSDGVDAVRLTSGARIGLPGLADTAHVAELGIRPEHVDVVAPGEGDLEAVADVIEHLGSDTNVYTVVDGLGPVMARVRGNVPARSGDRLGLRIRPEHVHLFARDGEVLGRNGGCNA